MDLEIPDGIRAMIRKKSEGLDAGSRLALQYASVEGEEFLSTVLAKLLDSDDLKVEEQLAALAKTHRLIVFRGEEELPDGVVARVMPLRTLSIRMSFMTAGKQTPRAAAVGPARSSCGIMAIAPRELPCNWRCISNAGATGLARSSSSSRGRQCDEHTPTCRPGATRTLSIWPAPARRPVRKRAHIYNAAVYQATSRFDLQ
jgi:hypothetical protein